MKTAYFDCFSGISGDMTLGALLDCGGADEDLFRKQLQSLALQGYLLHVNRVKREGISAIDVEVQLTESATGHGRHLSDIQDIVKRGDFSDRVKRDALLIFTRLADAEASIHGVTREDIHFHEVGAVDAIVDIVGTCILLDMLGIERIVSSPLPCGSGLINCQHGIMPSPAPATMELLKGLEVYSVDIRGELVTPTGAAILASLREPYSPQKMPSMTILSSGFGAGKKQFVKDMPNLLRVIIGDDGDRANSQLDDTLKVISVIETNVDDISPETFDLLMERAFAAGALDLFITPVHMKKNRPAHLVTILCPIERTDALCDIL